VAIHQKARIHFPWNVCLKDRAALGERSWIYSLDKITVDEGATVAQEVFLCTGSHNFNTDKYELITAPIRIGKDSFIGARANILPGVTLADRTIIGAASVVSKDTLPNSLYVGNPSKLIKTLSIT
jgi:putative colanic acid biosynthesis acetyltransferase WcaF